MTALAGPLPTPRRVRPLLAAPVGALRGFVERLDPLAVSCPHLTGQGQVIGKVEIVPGLDVAVGDRVWLQPIDGVATDLLITGHRGDTAAVAVGAAAGAVTWGGAGTGASAQRGTATGEIRWGQGVAAGEAPPRKVVFRATAPVSVVVNTKVLYGTITTDTAGTWVGGTTRTWTVPPGGTGTYMINTGCKSSGTVVTPEQRVERNGVVILTGHTGSGSAYVGGAIGGCVDLVAGDVIAVWEQGASYTCANDGTYLGANYLSIVKLY